MIQPIADLSLPEGMLSLTIPHDIEVYTDDGTGIMSEEKELIFRHGYGRHTGIGLFLARQILSISGFSIRETGEYGNGARFEITVPEGGFRYQIR